MVFFPTRARHSEVVEPAGVRPAEAAWYAMDGEPIWLCVPASVGSHVIERVDNAVQRVV